MIASMTLLMALMMPAAQEPAREPAAAQEPAVEAAAPASSMSADEHIQAGLAAFRRRRFSAARTHFEQAVEADANSAALTSPARLRYGGGRLKSTVTAWFATAVTPMPASGMKVTTSSSAMGKSATSASMSGWSGLHVYART